LAASFAQAAALAGVGSKLVFAASAIQASPPKVTMSFAA
jgi:hypothetical protein